MVAYEVETEDLSGIAEQLQLQAEQLTATRDGVDGASLEMLQTVAGAVTSTTGQIQQVLAALDAATRAAAGAADSADWNGPDAEEFRTSNATLLEAIAASEQQLQAAIAAHAASTAKLDSALREPLAVFSAEAGHNHDLTAQLGQAVVQERDSLEQAFNGTWDYAGDGAPAGSDLPVTPAPLTQIPTVPEKSDGLDGEIISLVLGVLPVVGTVKGVFEAFTGEDVVTGRKLEVWERFLGVIPVVGKLGAIPRVLRGLHRASEAGDAARAARAGRAGAEEARGASGADGAARGDGAVKGVNDPVDVATGRVFLPQVDVELPGAFPLVIGRRFDSGYRLGRSFGRSWATVLDERIERDDQGVLLVRSNGATLAYPAPVAGGAAVLPGSGTFRWPLTLDSEGVFRVSDPLSGVSYLYQAPPAGCGGSTESDPAWLVRVEDRAGRWWAIVRDPDHDGVPLLVVHHSGYQLAVRTDQHGRVLALDIPDPDDDSSDARLCAYGYDDAGHLTKVATATGGLLRFEYDDRGRMTRWVDTNDREYEYGYDDQDRCVRQGAADEVMAFSYAYTEGPAAGQVQTTFTNPLGQQTRYVADASSRLVLEEVDPAGGVTQHHYDEWGNPLSRTDPTGGTTHWTWDEQGRLTGCTDPLGGTTTLQHDTGEGGRDLVITNPDGASATYQLDDAGQVCAAIDPSGAVTRIETEPIESQSNQSGAGGSVVRVIDPLGGITTTTLDRAGLPLTIIGAAGTTTSIRRDGLGRPVEVRDPAGTLTSITWRIDSKPLTRTVRAGSELLSTESWEWDGEGNCTRYTDPAGRTTSTEFGPFDQPVAQTAPDGSRIEFVRDALLRPVRIVNQVGDSWALEYDPAGNVSAETDYAGRRIVREFDLAGRLTLQVNGAGQARSYRYDPAGRVESVTADGQVTRFTYDPVGRLVTAEGPEVAVERDYDPRGLLTTETVNGATTTWRYDTAGRLTGRTTPAGVETSRGYDNAGQLISLATGGHRLTLTHDRAGREVARAVASLTAGAGVVIASDWTPIGRLAGRDLRSAAGAAADWSVRYGYTPVGELASRVDSALGSSHYTVDDAGRVTSVSSVDSASGFGAGPGTAYRYDAAGNLTDQEPQPTGDASRTATGPATAGQTAAGQTAAGQTAAGRAWAYLKGRLIRAGRDRFGYDDQGRLVRRRRALLSGGSHDWTYTWDADDRLTRVTTPDGSTWRYSYDPFGRRIAKQQLRADGTLGERVTFVWEGAELIEQTTTDPVTGAIASVTWDRTPDGAPATHTTTARHDLTGGVSDIADPGSWDQARVDSQFYALVTDLVGAPIRAVSSDGEPAWVARPTLWNPAAGTASDRGLDVPLRFPGQYADAETGLFYNVHRYYDPETARYISPDPLGLAPAPNAYTYPANPSTHVDPMGLAPCTPPRFVTTPNGTTIDRLAVGTSVSAQRQGRHVLGAREYGGGSYFTSADDAQRVLDDFHSGAAEVLGVKGNDIVVRAPRVTGFNHNPGSGFPNQPTDVFFIKGGRSPSVVPFNPNWTP